MAGGHAWQGGMHGRGHVGGMHGKGHAWWRGCAWQGSIHGRGVCMAGGIHGSGGMLGSGGPPSRYYEIRSMSGRYSSYWNAFLFCSFSSSKV